MAQSTFSIRMDEGLKRLPRTCSDDSAARARQAFAALRAEAARREEPEMTLDEINAEIAAARAERRLRQQRHPA